MEIPITTIATCGTRKAQATSSTHLLIMLHKTSENQAGVNDDRKGGAPQNDTAPKKRPDLGPYNNEYNLFGGGSNDRDWLSRTHISQALELLQHTVHRYAINQPTVGSSHQVGSVDTLQHVLNMAAGGRPFNDGVDFHKYSLTPSQKVGLALQL